MPAGTGGKPHMKNPKTIKEFVFYHGGSPWLDCATLKASSTMLAQRSQLNSAARTMPACLRLSRRTGLSRTRSIAPASASTSTGSTSNPAEPTTSGNDAALDEMTGVPPGHRFEDRQAKSFVERRKNEGDGMSEKSAPLVIRHVTRPPHRSANSESNRQRPQRGSARTISSGNHQMNVSPAAGLSDEREGAQQTCQILPWLKRADKEKIPFRKAGAEKSAGRRITWFNDWTAQVSDFDFLTRYREMPH